MFGLQPNVCIFPGAGQNLTELHSALTGNIAGKIKVNSDLSQQDNSVMT